MTASTAILPHLEDVRFISEYIQLYSVLEPMMEKEKRKVELNRIDVDSIKKLIIEIGSPIIPLTLVFQGLGFGGVTGIEWGILAGAVSALATELGYKVERIGRSIMLVQHKEGLTQERDVAESSKKA
jgi:hypothetical protein